MNLRFLLLSLFFVGDALWAQQCRRSWTDRLLRRDATHYYGAALDSLEVPGFLEREDLQRKAIDNLNKSLLMDPTYGGSLRMRGFIRFMLGDFQEAARDFEQVVGLGDYTDSNLGYLLGVIMMMDGSTKNIAEAKRHFDAFIDSEGGLFKSYYGRGMTHFFSENYGQDADDMDVLVELGGTIADAYYSRAMIHLISGQYAKAQEDLNEAIGRSPEDARLRYWLATSLYAQGQNEKAVDELFWVLKAVAESDEDIFAGVDFEKPGGGFDIGFYNAIRAALRTREDSYGQFVHGMNHLRSGEPLVFVEDVGSAMAIALNGRPDIYQGSGFDKIKALVFAITARKGQLEELGLRQSAQPYETGLFLDSEEFDPTQPAAFIEIY